jgi:hypothetical protein
MGDLSRFIENFIEQKTISFSRANINVWTYANKWKRFELIWYPPYNLLLLLLLFIFFIIIYAFQYNFLLKPLLT